MHTYHAICLEFKFLSSCASNGTYQTVTFNLLTVVCMSYLLSSYHSLVYICEVAGVLTMPIEIGSQ